MAGEGKSSGIAAVLGSMPKAAGDALGADDTAQTAGIDAAQALIDAAAAGDAASVFEAFRDMLAAADGMAAGVAEELG